MKALSCQLFGGFCGVLIAVGATHHHLNPTRAAFVMFGCVSLGQMIGRIFASVLDAEERRLAEEKR